jgi:hypothetical protein
MLFFVDGGEKVEFAANFCSSDVFFKDGDALWRQRRSFSLTEEPSRICGGSEVVFC